MWVDENNLQKVGVQDIAKGSQVQFVKDNILVNGVLKTASNNRGDIIYEVEYGCSTIVSMRDIVKVIPAQPMAGNGNA